MSAARADAHVAPRPSPQPVATGDAPLVVRLSGREPGRGGRALLGRIGVAAALAAATAATGFAIDAAAGGGEDVLGPGIARVEVGIERSAFDVGSLKVREGTILEIVVRNDDPIDHELVVGGPEVHQRHQDGTERRHPPIPGEVSVAPGETGMTFYRFDEPGTVVYACHLPGHVAYGMVGEIEVVPA